MVRVTPAPIQLDTTLADLFRGHGIKQDLTTTTHCVFVHLDLHPNWPREVVYPEDEEPVPYGADEVELARLRKIILGLKSLRRAFVLGDTNVILFSSHANPQVVDRIFGQLVPEQRPTAKYIDLDQGNVEEKLHQITRGTKLNYWRPQGWMDQHDCLIKPALLFEMFSKKYLITAGIKTPESEMISLDDVESTSFLPSHRLLPFVVKLCLAGCGFGTYIVTSESRRKEMLAAMVEYKKKGGVEVMVSKYIDLKADLSVHYMVGAPGDVNDRSNPLLVAVTVQNLTENGHWTGGSIDYAAQPELKALLMETVRETTMRLPEEFVGWCGVDIVIDADGGQWVVDLNPRLTGSMLICLLSNHFYKRLGLRYAEFAAFQYSGAPEDAFERLAPFIHSGQVIVNSIASIDDNLSMIDLTWGAGEKAELERMVKLIKDRLQ